MLKVVLETCLKLAAFVQVQLQEYNYVDDEEVKVNTILTKRILTPSGIIAL